MTSVMKYTDRQILTGDGNLVEGDRILGRVSYRLVRTNRPPDLPSVEGSASAAPGSEIGFLDLLTRRAELTLVLPNGTWECYVTKYDPHSGSVRLVNRSGTRGLQLDDDPGQ